jgi:hypothetical protein
LYKARVGIQENCGKEPDFFHCVRIALEDDPVANVEWVLDEQKYDARQHFLQAPTNQPTKTCTKGISNRDFKSFFFKNSTRTENQGASTSNQSCQRRFLIRW